MISGFACAVPAIMTQGILRIKRNYGLVTPLMSCSARLPVFTILISLVVPNTYYFSFLSLQGLVMMAQLPAWYCYSTYRKLCFKICVKLKKNGFILSYPRLPELPRWKNVAVTVIEKAKIFVVDAGRVILMISLLLWFLSSYGPSSG